MKCKSLFLLFGILISSNLFAQGDLRQVAETLSKHKYKKVYRCFDKNLKSKISADKLEEIWSGLESINGELKQVDDVVTEQINDSRRQTGVLKFTTAALKLIVSFNANDRINGIFISQMGYSLPEYGRDLAVGKRFIAFNSHDNILSGELVIPKNCNQCPVVILVHGSGPNDKDETIGPNKVFKDLALGLAAKGVASFRYDKRFKLYPDKMKEPFDIYDETVNDAITAYDVLNRDTSLNFGKYVMLGHSLGAYAIPLLTDSLKQLNGAVLFSSNARRFEDLIVYQMNYLTSWDGEITPEEAELVATNLKNAEKIRNGLFTDSTSAEELLAYWPGKFWNSIKDYNPVNTLSQQDSMHFFVMQGEKDYQITMVDYKIWLDKVGNNSNVTMRSYPNLSHLFTPTKSEKPGPSDYFYPNNVSELAINDIADWIRLVVP